MATPSIATFSRDLDAVIAQVQSDDAARKELLGVLMGAQAALMTLLDMGAIDKLATSKKPLHASELVPSGGDPELVVRMMRPLSQLGIVAETDEETYAATGVTHALKDPILLGGYTFMFNAATHSLAHMPSFLREHQFKNVEGNPGPFQYARNTKLDLFPWLSQESNLPLMHHFGYFMGGQQATRGNWFDRMPVDSMFLSGAVTDDPESTLLVDIGGGKGHDVAAFHKAFPRAPGKLVLQDLPPVIESIDSLDPAIVQQPYDFFTEQPVKGARVYYFRSIMHDWATDKCVEILRIVTRAMKPGYSKLLLNEFVLPARNVPLYPALLDVNMMALLNGMERTEKQFTHMLELAGLKVIKFHTDPTGENEGIIEAELK